MASTVINRRSHRSSTLGRVLSAILVGKNIDNESVILALNFAINALSVSKLLTLLELLLLGFC